MPILTIIAIVVFAGYALYTRVYSPPQSASVSGEVMSESDIQSSPSASMQTSPKASAVPSASSSASSGKSQIDIKVDTKIGNTTSSSEKIVYPGVSPAGDNRFETNIDGDTVYNWYKEELGKRSFQIRNNVRTKANDKFKAILQGVSDNTSIKVTIEQENGGAKTIITLE